MGKPALEMTQQTKREEEKFFEFVVRTFPFNVFTKEVRLWWMKHPDAFRSVIENTLRAHSPPERVMVSMLVYVDRMLSFEQVFKSANLTCDDARIQNVFKLAECNAGDSVCTVAIEFVSVGDEISPMSALVILESRGFRPVDIREYISFIANERQSGRYVITLATFEDGKVYAVMCRRTANDLDMLCVQHQSSRRRIAGAFIEAVSTTPQVQ